MLAEKSRNTLCLLWRLLKYALPQWRLVILALLATVIYSATQAVPAALTKRLLDDALLKQDTDLLLLLCFIAIGAAVVAGATCFIKEYFRQRVLFRAIVDIRQHAGEYVLTLSMGYFDRKKVGELMSRMTNDIQATRQALDFMTGDIIEAPLTIAAALAVALHNCWQLTLLSLLSLPVFWILVVRFGKRVKKHSSRSLVQLAQVTESMQQMISGVRVVKAFGLEKQKAEEFRRENESFFHKVMRMVFTKALSRSLIEASYMAGVAVLVLAGGYLVISSAWGLTLGGFGTFCGALATMYLPCLLYTS
ncbi:MAG: ABC transporter transmembrane domain-containing protein, partial [Planctomycetota bacterium]|nr:ABC transporter transmembrane domain-containing protein [Planctomycetota bacterium]